MAEPLRLDRALFALTGAGVEDFLQNLLTQDVTRLAHAPVVYSGLLTPQGKVVADFFLWRIDGGVWVDVARAQAEDLRRRLMLYRLRVAVEIGEIDEGLGVFAALDGGEGIQAAADPRHPDLGRRLIRAVSTQPPGAEPGAYRARRIAVGAPDLAYDAAPEETFALEALFEELHGVDFQKGCFVGQENVSRMKRRATTRKKFCPVVFEGAPPAFGAPITAGAADLGSVRTGVEGRALAFLRLDRAQAASAPLIADGRTLRLDPPPWLLLPEPA